MAADRYCEDLVREADKDRFLASLFAPAERRPALLALYAFNALFSNLRFGYGAARSVIVFLVTFALALLYLRACGEIT